MVAAALSTNADNDGREIPPQEIQAFRRRFSGTGQTTFQEMS